jgi:hypothetical protein
VILGSHNGTDFNKVIISKKDGTQVKLITAKVGYDLKGITTGDFNGDGISEIAVFCDRTNKNLTDRIVIFSSDGSVYSDFRANDRKSEIKNINNIISADLNDDGIDELVVSCSQTGELPVRFNNLVAFSGSGTYLYSNFNYPGNFNFSGIAGGDFDSDKAGEEIVIYEPYHSKYDRIIIYSNNLSKANLYCYTGQNERVNYKLLSITGGDIDGDGLDEIVTTSKNKVVIFKNKSYLKEFTTHGNYNLLGVSCADFDKNGIENISVYRSHGDLNPLLNDWIIVFNSTADGDILYDFRYLNLGYNSPQVIGICAGNFEPKYPLLYLNKSEVQKLNTLHPFYTDRIAKASQYNFIKLVNGVRPWYACSDADRNLHFNLAKFFKYAGILSQKGESGLIIDECIRAFNQYAIKYELAYNAVKNNYPRQQGVFIQNLLHECFWLEEICWAYDLLYDRMPQPVIINIRNKLLRLAAKRQIGYSPGRNNHANGHNLAIAAVGFLLDDKRLLGLAYNGTDICEDLNQKRAWRGLYEQLQSSDENDPVTFDYIKVRDAKPIFTNIGIYLPDYTLYEGTTSYAYHDIGHLTRTAAMADNNNYHNIDEYYYKIDEIAKSFLSTVFPFQKGKMEATINFPALSDDILQGLKTVSYLDILHSKFYTSSHSPYATILSKNRNTFENFIFSTNNYSNQNDSLINKSRNLEHAGWAILRSGQSLADSKKIMALMDYGPYGGNNHGHADRFNIILYSNYDNENKQLIGDIGNLRRANKTKLGYYNKLHNKYVRSTISHNTILINNNRQADPNKEIKTKCQSDLSLYGGGLNISSEASYANKKCSDISFDSDNSDSLQYIYAKSGYNSCYGPNYSIERTIAMIADKYIVDIVNIEKKPGATIKFIDWVIRGPNRNIMIDHYAEKADDWDWERSTFAIANPNESYNYFYNIDTTKSDIGINWKTQWLKTSGGSDTLLHIYGINTEDQRLITALSPDSSSKYDLDPQEIKASIIIRKYGISGDWSPEFLTVLQPNGVPSIQNISVVNSLLVIKCKDEKTYIFDYKNKILQ